jgi:hypothetical protein
MKILKKLLLGSATALCLSQMLYGQITSPIKHVILISIDGLHAFDLRDFIDAHPHSALARLAQKGVLYKNAYSPAPADSFPGLMALITGGTPGVTGVYYDTTYDRNLSPAGSDCKTKGAIVMYDESIDQKGILHGKPLMNPELLPRNPQKGCTPEYPNQYLHVNTIFNVIAKAGGYTAWIDKHPVYEIVDGPNGPKVNDLYTPEIGKNAEGKLVENSTRITASIVRTERYDDKKMRALINEMEGYTHDRSKKAPVPAIAGMNFQTINVAQKIVSYKNAYGIPTKQLESALKYCDSEIAKLVSVLKKEHLMDKTMLVITAKTGNGPINPKLVYRVRPKEIKAVVDHTAAHALAWEVTDRIALLWLHEGKDTQKIVHALRLAEKKLHIRHILYGRALREYFHVKKGDNRIPDIIILPKRGVIYTSNMKKLEEHGGWGKNDRNVALLVSNKHLRYQDITVNTRVSTTQVAPTILYSLGIAPQKLQAVREENVQTLPYIRKVR